MKSIMFERIKSLFLFGKEKESKYFDQNVRVISTYDDLSCLLDAHYKIGWIFLHKHDKTVNTLDDSVQIKINEILSEIDKLINEESIHALVIFSLKPNNFIAGADVKIISSIQSPEEGKHLAQKGHQLLLRMERLPIPTVCAIHGNCLGGGLEVALSTDYRIATSDPNTKIGLPEIKLGVLPALGGTIRLPRLIGLSKALSLILSGDLIDAEHAKSLKIVDQIFTISDMDFFFQETSEYVKEIGDKWKITKNKRNKFKIKTLSFVERLLDENMLGRVLLKFATIKTMDGISKRQFPAPYVALESALKSYTASSLKEAIDIETESFGILSCTPECKSLVRLFELSERVKRVENFCDIKSDELSQLKDVDRVLVIGSGEMAAGIIQLSALKNIRVDVAEMNVSSLKQLEEKTTTLFDEMIQKKKLSPEKMISHQKMICYSDDIQSKLKDVDLVIITSNQYDTLIDNLLKQEKSIQQKTIIYANIDPSNLPLSSIMNVVPIQFYTPLHKLLIHELCPFQKTSAKAIAESYKYLLKIGRYPIITPFGMNSYFSVRMLGLLILECITISMSGIPFRLVDQAMEEIGCPLGPFKILFSLRVSKSIPFSLFDSIAQEIPEYKEALDLLETHAYKEQQSLWKSPKLNINTTVESNQQRVQEIKKIISERCILNLINHVTSSLSHIENMNQHIPTVDLISVMLLGFAPSKGGILKYADDLGLTTVVGRLESLSKSYNQSRYNPNNLLVQMAKAKKCFTRSENLKEYENGTTTLEERIAESRKRIEKIASSTSNRVFALAIIVVIVNFLISSAIFYRFFLKGRNLFN